VNVNFDPPEPSSRSAVDVVGINAFMGTEKQRISLDFNDVEFHTSSLFIVALFYFIKWTIHLWSIKGSAFRRKKSLFW
jgi:hypothetical protein